MVDNGYRPAVTELLDDRPQLQHQIPDVADRVGCSYSTALRYVREWQSRRANRWIMEPAVQNQRRNCSDCPHRLWCQLLDACELNLLCERVSEPDAELARNRGTYWLLLESRSWPTAQPTPPRP